MLTWLPLRTVEKQFEIKNRYISPAAFDISKETAVDSHMLSHFDLSPTALLAKLADALSRPD